MTRQQATDLFETYVQRVGQGATFVPDALREGAPVPKTWPYSPEAWEELAVAAREHLRLKPQYDFAYSIAVKGFYPDELATGELHSGAQINAATGEVVRHWQEQDDGTMARAREALHGLAEANIHLDGIMETVLQAAAAGGHAGHPKTVARIVEMAESAIRNEHARREAAAKEEAARPVLTVRFRFRAHRQYQPGTYRIPVEEVGELHDWQAKMEAERDLHEWDAPAGYCPENWPPFVLEDS